jgi:hypothetical protein
MNSSKSEGARCERPSRARTSLLASGRGFFILRLWPEVDISMLECRIRGRVQYSRLTRVWWGLCPYLIIVDIRTKWRSLECTLPILEGVKGYR